MHKLLFAALLSLPAMADFFPTTVYTAVSQADDNRIKLAKPLPYNGMSAIVVHRFKGSAKAITSYIVQNGSDGTAAPLDRDIIHHDELPTISTPIAPKDKVVGGLMYNNVLLLAPDANTYAKITSQHNKNWIHPDLYAVFLSDKGEDMPTRENLSAFAKQYQVGLVYIIRNKTAVLLDPLSKKIIKQKTISDLPKKGQFPFFTRFDKISSGWFSSETEESYYQTMEKL